MLKMNFPNFLLISATVVFLNFYQSYSYSVPVSYPFFREEFTLEAPVNSSFSGGNVESLQKLKGLNEDANFVPRQEHERISRAVGFRLTNKIKNIILEKAQPGRCFFWGGSHVKTFDEEVFSFSSSCAHTLVRDEVDDTFSIVVQDSSECFVEPDNCHSVVKIYLQDQEYILEHSEKGMPIFTSEGRVLPLPGNVPGIRAEIFGNYILILIDSLGLKIKWNGEQMVQVDAQENLWNKTAGLCGTMDGDHTNDLLTKSQVKSKSISTLVSSWQVDTLGVECNEAPLETHKCNDAKLKNKRKEAINVCKKIISDKRFFPCQTIKDIRLLFDVCIWDYCSCRHWDPNYCICETLNVYVRECTRRGINSLVKWRDENMCPMQCSGGRVYMPCAPSGGQVNCGEVSEKLDEDVECEEGCYCPEKTVLHNSQCIRVAQCPCWYHGRDYPSGSTVPKDCNTCTCTDGKWDCTKKSCNVRCSVVGDPHYTTFDGKRFDFMGTCSYYLVQHENFTIEAENKVCGTAGAQGKFPSCAREVTVKTAGQVIKLKQNREIIVNGLETKTVPFNVGGATVRAGSSNFIIVTLPNGVEIWWDSAHTAYIDVPPSCKGKTKGLCGTFTLSQKDDFLTPEGDTEESVAAFANKWKTSEKCDDVPNEVSTHPCTVNVQNKPSADMLCSVIKSELFKVCHQDVDPESFYQDCMYDMCSCDKELTKCFCPMVAAYVRECAIKGKKIEWTKSVTECGTKCPTGQMYQICGNSCLRSCYDITTLSDCQPQCIEGCNCPEGEALDDKGECIPIVQCDCQYDGLNFPPGYKQVRPASKGPELCTCIAAQWNCHRASHKDIKKYPNVNDLKSRCNASENKEFTICEPAEPITCKNMHQHEPVTIAVCHAGCQCKKGYVLDSFTKICVKPSECRCHHGGRSYSENLTVQNDCNICTCIQAKWQCTKKICPAECTAWGDSHYKTFDGRSYDYQGQCDYILAKGILGNEHSFDISIQNVPCGTLGVSCSKSITIRAGTLSNLESITLIREKEIPDHATLKHLIIRQKGHFVIVEAPVLGLIIRWDKGTRVYVKLDSRWKNRVKGLCGNYNDNQLDDFQTPSGGITEVSPLVFGDSWRLQLYCPNALDITDTCKERPDRKIWALKKCNILKSSVFANCHSEVPVETYLDRCIFDTCACDQGGDCECLCTALAAYAQECNNRGVPIKWRTPELCPMQCDERCSQYSPCVSTCSTETCDNMLIHSQLSTMCQQDTCIEGCQVNSCPMGSIYSNSSLLDCVPRNACLPICLEIDGKQFYEGELIEQDACHSCYCSRGKKVCQGQPCQIPGVKSQGGEGAKCVSGWTDWLNQDQHVPEKLMDVEPLPTSLIMNNLDSGSYCDVENMIDIECQTVYTHIPAKETGLDVECSLERGLICNSAEDEETCPDFEIRVKCACGEETTTAIITERPPETCDVTKPYQAHSLNCHLYYYCELGQETTLVEKTCGSDKLFNPITAECDLPEAVIAVRPECEEVPGCPPGEEYRDCATNCNRLCLYYSFIVKQSGRCHDETKCEAGCTSDEKQFSCLPGMFWADKETCVNRQDCMCISDTGNPVKPGEIVREADCKVCQCIDNYYACNEFACSTTYVPEVSFTVVPTENTPVFIVVSTVTPPAECNEEDYISLIDGDIPLSDEAFSASSISSERFQPKYGRLSSTTSEKSGGSWVPKDLDSAQYLRINLGRQEPIYGVIIKGSPSHDEYVTSYRVMYGPSTEALSSVTDHKRQPKVFRGSVDGNTPVRSMFDVPVEAQIVSINPQTWHKKIALRVELIGCRQFVSTITTEVPTRIPAAPLCSDPMGVDDGRMYRQQISVSSERDHAHGKDMLKLGGKFAWQPVTNSPSEWVQFDFLEARNITGVVTKGGYHGWVTLYNIRYSHNGKDWNPILDNKDNEKVFLGNIDESMPQVNNFDVPIQTTLLRIIPIKWFKNIQLRVEILGCYDTYPTPYTPIEVPTPCNECPGVSAAETCRCKEGLWWDGDNCVERSQCSCLVGHLQYAVGTVFENDECARCTCRLGGVSHCTPKVCPKCDMDLKSIVTSTCSCICQACEEGTILCPTSNICINATDWCNGVKDCPDDETNCEVSTTVQPTFGTTELVEATKKLEKKCKPPPTCAPGYKLKVKNVTEAKSGWDRRTMFTTYNAKGGTKTFTTKGGGKTGAKSTGKQEIPPTTAKATQVCPLHECVSTKPPPKFPGEVTEICPEAYCSPGYVIEYDMSFETELTETCPRYECNAPEIDAECEITGRTFKTFDDTEYKYDICNHVLIRDLEDQEWEASLMQSCTVTCSRDLVIHHEDDIFVLHPDLSVEYNGYQYNLEQIKKIGAHSHEFAISQIGEALVFVSNKFGFWAIWDNQENAKLGVSQKLLEKVDGLCGYFNDEPKDDKRKPDGTLAKTTAEFGDSWAQLEQPLICEAKVCPVHVQNKAWEMCNLIRDKTFSSCAKVVDLDAFVSRCLETTCTCLEMAEGKVAEEQCRCLALQRFVVDCLTTNSEIEIIDWRMKHGCPADCETPLVHHDCYRRRCEPSCGSLSSNACPKLDHVCFPGCYCPAGYVRKGESCILPTTCGDCECNVLPHLEYITYDEKNFTINGNCTYIMSQDIVHDTSNKHKFQVLITNQPCEGKVGKMCMGKVTILYEQHEIYVVRDLDHQKLKLIADSESEKLVHITQDPSKHLRILLYAIQIHISVYYPSLGVSIKAPSLKYGGKLEGLCGNCNDNPNDDFRTSEGRISSSWLHGDHKEEECANQPEEICKQVPIDSDPCLQLENTFKYKQCNPVLKPDMFIDWCKKDTCNGHPELSCAAVEAYALECGHLGFCIDWRTNLCPPKDCSADQEYKPCAPVCSQTCEALRDKEGKCTNPPIEGCFCPEGKLFLNDTCVVADRCEACDDEGHRSGDIWHTNACTTCTCEGINVKCETQQCPSVKTICEEGFRMEKVPAAKNECCEKYICAQVPTTTAATCVPPRQQSCSVGQVMKLIRKADGCQQYVCECKPTEDCEPVDEELLVSSEPGIVKDLDRSGCCPAVKEICNTGLCPKPPECPSFYTVEEIVLHLKCCPTYTCVHPKDKCIVDLQYTADERGGERLRNEFEQVQVLKMANETWQDGPCRECECTVSFTGDYHDTCVIRECPIVSELAENQEFFLEVKAVVDQCCPNIKKVACKHNGIKYKVGDKWSLEDNHCTTFECTEPSSGIQKMTQTIQCDTKCELGSKYVPATPESKKCCGSCKPFACTIDGIIYDVGDTWSSHDHCVLYSCSNSNGTIQVQSSTVSCPKLTEELVNDYEIDTFTATGECCPIHKIVACKVGSKTYKVGETWSSPDGDKCKKVTCTVKNEEISKKEIMETCNRNCSKGWEYEESDSKCCGECVQKGCLADDTIKKKGENWTSPDGCVTYFCDTLGDQLTVVVQEQSCPDISKCPTENIYDKGCCKYCNLPSAAQVQCSAMELDIDATVGIISTFRPSHGQCMNKKGLKGFTECSGSCESHTKFNSESGRHDSLCRCCQVTEYMPFVVELECEDGHSFKKQVAIPLHCGCEQCASEHEAEQFAKVQAQ